MKFHLQPTVRVCDRIIQWQVRAWLDATKGWGDAFDFVATVTRDGDTAEVTAALGALTISGSRELIRQLRELGIQHVTWEHKAKRIERDISHG